MTELTDILCMFSAHIERNGNEYTITVPTQEVEIGDLEEGEIYRFAALDSVKGGVSGSSGESVRSEQAKSYGKVPVEEGDIVEVEIEDQGEEGDGIARIGPGFVIFVENGEIGDRLTVEVTAVNENYAFADVVQG